jgi:hypothetical protein
MEKPGRRGIEFAISGPDDVRDEPAAVGGLDGLRAFGDLPSPVRNLDRLPAFDVAQASARVLARRAGLRAEFRTVCFRPPVLW